MINVYIENKDKDTLYVLNFIFGILGYPYKIVSTGVYEENIGIDIIYGMDISFTKNSKCACLYIDRNDNKNMQNQVKYNDNSFYLNYLNNEFEFIDDLEKFLCINIEKKLYYIKFDIFKNIFDSITCKREYNITKKDEHDRFIAEFIDNNDILTPKVDLLIKFIDISLLKIYKNSNLPLLKKNMWPNEKDFCVFLSHDVDRIYEKEKYNILSHIKKIIINVAKFRFKIVFKEIKYTIWTIIKNENNFNDFNKFMDIEEHYNSKSAFYFIGDYKKNRYGARYSIDKIGDIFNSIKARGFEIGIHGGYNTYKNLSLFNNEKLKIEKYSNCYVLGNRQHYLRFNIPKTYEVLQEAKLLYDSSIGFSDQIGYRAGTGFPYYLYNINNQKLYDILEIPLVIMDGCLFEHGNLSKDKILSNIKKMIDNTKLCNSCISLLWHVSVTDEYNFPGWINIYKEILDYISKNYNAYITNGKEITKWLESKNEFEIIGLKRIDEVYEYSIEYKNYERKTMWFYTNSIKIISVSGAYNYIVKDNLLIIEAEKKCKINIVCTLSA